MKTAVVKFRADGDATMGLGHLFRSAALASMLSDSFECHLVYYNCPDPVRDRLHKFFAIVTRACDVETLSHLEGATIVVLDGYHFSQQYQQDILERGYRLVCLDDLHRQTFFADLVINQSPLNTLSAYYDLAPRTTLVHGLSYSLLRPVYRSAMQTTYRPQIRSGYLVCFGGADTQNITARIIRELIRIDEEQPIWVILGPANSHRTEVEESLSEYKGAAKILVSLNDAEMVDLYRRVEIAFLPASTVMVEAVALGVKVISGYYVDNQLDLYRGYIQCKLTIGIGDWTQTFNLKTAIEATRQNDEPQTNGLCIIDKHSDVNVRLLFEQLGVGQSPIIVSQLATGSDIKTYYAWASDPVVRRNSISGEDITYERHVEWFSEKVLSASTLLIRFSCQGQPIGQVRFDEKPNQTVELDYSIDRNHRGKGLASRILTLAERQCKLRKPNVRAIVAVVKKSNTPSLQALTRVGYTEYEESPYPDSQFSRLAKKL